MPPDGGGDCDTARWRALLLWMSSVFAVLHGCMAFLYAVPRLSVLPPRGPQVSVVAYIGALGPVWVVGFGLSGLLLVASVAWWRAVLSVAHALACGVMGALAIALWIGALASQPEGPVVSAALATAVTAAHIALSWFYVEQEVRQCSL